MAVRNKGLKFHTFAAMAKLGDSDMNISKLETALEAAFANAIRSYGFANFKRTSVFGSSQRPAVDQLKKAA
jgi:hypothetical protein